MTVQYLPGWWDELNKNNAFGNLVSQIPAMLNPDRSADNKLREMAQQDPTLMTRIANMGDAERQALADTMGYKKKNPFQALPAGEERKNRELKDKFMTEVMGDPIKAAEFKAKLLGIKTDSERQLDQVTLEQRVIDKKTGQLKLDVLEKETKRLGDILAKSSPDLLEAAKAVAFGKSLPAEVFQRINADETLAPTFQEYIKGFQLEREYSFRKTLQSMKTPAERAMAISWVEKELDNVRMNIIPLRNKLMGRDALLGQITDPAKFQADSQELARQEQKLKDLEDVYAEEMRKQGVKLPRNSAAPVGPITPGPFANPSTRPSLGGLDASLFGRKP